MSRILVLGHEHPGMAEGTIEARSYRTWQFVEPLLENGHQVCLIVSPEKINGMLLIAYIHHLPITA